ncbi:MAG: RNA-binding S4 domain-containing protein, partial [Porphyromonadaceae bacterium]|nr:RNA-binding S4 domain-containing protein [Porphyromonadaceae bacterium]
MDSEFKPRRPRIGENRGEMNRENGDEKHERPDYSRRNNFERNTGYRKPYPNENRFSRPRDFSRNYDSADNSRHTEEEGFNRYGSYRPSRRYGEGQSGETPERCNSNYPNRYDRNDYATRRPYRPHTEGNGESNNYNSTGENRPYRANRFTSDNNRSGYNRPYGNPQHRPYGNNNRPQRPITPSVPRRVIYDESSIDPNAPIRLNKFLANAGLCSRREADEFIQKGEIKVNGKVVTELGSKITRNDVVTHNDKVVLSEHKIYVLLNKPKNCVTTSEDPQGRLTVMDIVRNACTERIYPVGRLDRNTTGVLLLTNDGDLASKLTHPQFIKKKIYHVWLDRDIPEEDLQRIADGIELDDGPIHADAI